MKFSKLFLLVVLVTISHYAAHAADQVVQMNNKEIDATSMDDEVFDHLSPSGSLRGNLLFDLQSTQKGLLACDKYPRVCRAKGSAGPDCCRKKCVNVETDRNNCGMCGNRCKYSKICCDGKCVNPMFNKMHCGGCSNGCSKGSLCVYGMCGYA